MSPEQVERQADKSVNELAAEALQHTILEAFKAGVAPGKYGRYQ